MSSGCYVMFSLWNITSIRIYTLSLVRLLSFIFIWSGSFRIRIQWTRPFWWPCVLLFLAFDNTQTCLSSFRVNLHVWCSFAFHMLYIFSSSAPGRGTISSRVYWGLCSLAWAIIGMLHFLLLALWSRLRHVHLLAGNVHMQLCFRFHRALVYFPYQQSACQFCDPLIGLELLT